MSLQYLLTVELTKDEAGMLFHSLKGRKDVPAIKLRRELVKLLRAACVPTEELSGTTSSSLS